MLIINLDTAMQIKELDKYLTKSYNDDVIDSIEVWASAHVLSVNTVPTHSG